MTGTKYIFSNVVLHLALGLILIIFIQYSNFDVWVSNQFFNALSNQFILQKYSTLGNQLHDKSKIILIIIGLIFWLISLGHIIKNEWFINKNIIKKINFISAMSIIIPVIILIIRDNSLSHCPRDLIIFNGSYNYFKLLDIQSSGLAPGHCNPASHAASFVWLMSIPWAFLNGSSRVKAYFLTILFAILMSSVQIARGAHFLSHILWSVWISSFIITIAYEFHSKKHQDNG